MENSNIKHSHLEFQNLYQLYNSVPAIGERDGGHSQVTDLMC